MEDQKKSNITLSKLWLIKQVKISFSEKKIHLANYSVVEYFSICLLICFSSCELHFRILCSLFHWSLLLLQKGPLFSGPVSFWSRGIKKGRAVVPDMTGVLDSHKCKVQVFFFQFFLTLWYAIGNPHFPTNGVGSFKRDLVNSRGVQS